MTYLSDASSGLAAGLMLLVPARGVPRAGAMLLIVALVGLAAPAGRAESLIDEDVRATMLARPNGRLAHVETETHIEKHLNPDTLQMEEQRETREVLVEPVGFVPHAVGQSLRVSGTLA